MVSKQGASEGGLVTRLGEILSETSTEADWELVTAFVAASHSANGPVLGFNDHVVLTNDAARQWLEPGDQDLLQHLAPQSRTADTATSTMLTLSHGPVRLHWRTVIDRLESARAGVLVRAEFLPASAPDTAWRSGVPTALPGLVGSAPSWRRCCDELEMSYRRGEWVALTGEPGVGKHAVATAVHHRHHPGVWAQTSRPRAAVTATGFWERLHTDPSAALILRHADRLSRASAASLTTLLTAVVARFSNPWVVATLAPSTVVGPSWPGNITALNDVLTHLARTHRHASTLEPSDLPAEYRAVSRRVLHPLAAREREAIVHALRATRRQQGARCPAPWNIPGHDLPQKSTSTASRRRTTPDSTAVRGGWSIR